MAQVAALIAQRGRILCPSEYPKSPTDAREPYTQWIDIYNRLYRERIIFLGKEVDDEIANQIVAVMLYLDSERSGQRHHALHQLPRWLRHRWHGNL